MTIADTLRQLGLSSPDPRSDAELVGLFVRTRDEQAFAELLRRHGPTVYGVCRRVVGNAADADDAFQAVFLVLARKANTVRPPGMVGNWLYGVTVRTAKKVRVMNAKRIRRESSLLAPRADSQPARGASRTHSDTLTLIDAELAALPDVYRAAFVTCELNGRSRSEASAELGWPEGTVATRLTKARELLAARLTKRGVTLGVGLFAAVAVPAATATETLAAVRELLAVGTASAVAPAAQTLSDEVTKSMTTFHWKLAAVGLVALFAVGGAVLVAAPGDKPVRELIKAPVPKAAEGEWKEADPITFKDGGRVKCIAFAPSGKTFAVCRAGGQIDFFDPATRKHQQSMNFLGDKKSNPKREGGTVPALAFRPTPHAKLGDVFAVTHKNGVNFGTTNIGLLVDERQVTMDDLPGNFRTEGFDPHQVMWHTDESVEATNGRDRLIWTLRAGSWQVTAGGTDTRDTHRPTVMASLAGGTRSLWLVLGSDRKGIELIAFPTDGGSERPLLSGHKSRPITAAAASDGKRVVTADEKGTLIVWDDEFKEKGRTELGEGVQQLALAPDGKTVAAVRVLVRIDTGLSGVKPMPTEYHDWSLGVYDLTAFANSEKPKPVYAWKDSLLNPVKGAVPGPASLAFSPDGRTLLAAFADPHPEADDPKERGLVPKSMGVKVWELVPKK